MVVALLLGVAGGVGAANLAAAPAASPESVASLARAVRVTTTVQRPSIVVQVSGAVVQPGVYEFAEGARLADALARAGGALLEADVSRVNLAGRVADGTAVYIPLRGESPAGPPDVGVAGGPSVAAQSAVVDINRASATELEALPGIGPATAAALVRYRSAHGPLRSLEDLLAVPGLGPAKVEALRVHVRF